MIGDIVSVLPAAVIAERATLLAQVLRVDLRLVAHVQTVRLLQRPLKIVLVTYQYFWLDTTKGQRQQSRLMNTVDIATVNQMILING